MKGIPIKHVKRPEKRSAASVPKHILSERDFDVRNGGWQRADAIEGYQIYPRPPEITRDYPR